MTRSRVRYVVALSFAVLYGVVVLSTPASAVQPDQKAVKLAFVDAGSPSTAPKGLPAFWDRLRELGYVEGHNLTVERRWADGHLERLPALMAEVVGQKIDVLVTYSTPAGVAAKHATSTIPIVVAAMGDPLGIGLVASLAHPGGNLTGVSLDMTEDLTGKWLEIVQEVLPRVSTLAVLSNPDSPLIAKLTARLRVAASARGVTLRFVDVRTPGALENAFKQAKREAQAMLVLPDPVTTTNRKEIAGLAAKSRVPTCFGVHARLWARDRHGRWTSVEMPTRPLSSGDRQTTVAGRRPAAPCCCPTTAPPAGCGPPTGIPSRREHSTFPRSVVGARVPLLRPPADRARRHAVSARHDRGRLDVRSGRTHLPARGPGGHRAADGRGGARHRPLPTSCVGRTSPGCAGSTRRPGGQRQRALRRARRLGTRSGRRRTSTT